MYNICLYFFMYIFFSILGWLMECVSCSIENKKLILDRGFLFGPYCPIYGVGTLFTYFTLNKYYDEPITLFVLAMVGTSIIEYLTSFFMEKIFKARWWDYSDRRFNLEGRICLRNSILFGIMGVLFIYFVSPAFISIVDRIPDNILIIVSIVLFIIFLIDNILTFSIIGSLKTNLHKLHKDSTSDIDKQMKTVLTNYRFYITRLYKAFPKLKISAPRGEKITSYIKNYLDNLEDPIKKTKKKLKEIKKNNKESK